MKKLILVLLLVPTLCFGEQHVLFGRDWSRLDPGQKAMVLEGMVMGLFAAQEVVKNELTAANLLYSKTPGDFTDVVNKINKAVLLQLSRIPSEKLLVELLDTWASQHPDSDVPEAFSALIMNSNLPLILKAENGRGPSSGYDDITRTSLGFIKAK